jgi:hypothetical protein
MSRAANIEQWNIAHPLGTIGTLRKDNGEFVDTKIRGKAQEIGGQVCAFFEGVTGSYMVDRFTVAGKPRAYPNHEPPLLIYPEKIDDTLLAILGRPSFTCRDIAGVLRAGGIEIPPKAEAEQAHTLHYLLKTYLRHGERWDYVAEVELLAMIKRGAAETEETKEAVTP